MTYGNKDYTIIKPSGIEISSNSIVLSSLVSLSVVSLSLGFFTLYDGYLVTIAALVIFAYCIYMLNYLRIGYLTTYLFIISFILINALVHASSLDAPEFIKSFLLTSVMIFVYLSSLKPIYSLWRKINFSFILRTTTYLIFGFAVIQTSEQIFFSSYSSWFWLDGISISTATEIGRFEAVYPPGFIRPVSFFHEPSYFAAVSFILLLINDRIDRIKHVSYLLLLSIVFSFSAIGTGILVAYLISKILVTGSSRIYLFIPFFFRYTSFLWQHFF